jgi:3-hydroxyacyl-CoA dehydrogenase
VELLRPQRQASQDLPDETIAPRLIALLTDDGRQVLMESIADSPQAISLVEVHGYGFPRH